MRIASKAKASTTDTQPEFTEVTTRGTLDARATNVLKELRASDEPIAKQTLAGADVGATGMLSMLVALGFAKRMRGGRGVAYIATDKLRAIK